MDESAESESVISNKLHDSVHTVLFKIIVHTEFIIIKTMP